MTSDPLVSILVPAYNAGQTIAETLQSAIEQTWRNTEIIVVDDGSTDATLRIAQSYDGEKIRIVSQENQGAAAARNHALQLSRGDYIQWLDADDLLSANKVEAQIQAAVQDGDDTMLYSSPWAFFYVRPSKARFQLTPLWENLSPIEWLTRKWEGNHHMQTATWLVSRRLAEIAGEWDTRLLGDDDGEYFFRVISRSKGIRFVSGGKVYYRVMEANRLSYIGDSDRKIEAQSLGMKNQIASLLALEDSPRSRAACITYLQTWLCHFYPNRQDLVSEMQDIAHRLGGELQMPKATWKYAVLEHALGFEAAKRYQLAYNRQKTRFLISWDRALKEIMLKLKAHDG